MNAPFRLAAPIVPTIEKHRPAKLWRANVKAIAGAGVGWMEVAG